MDWGFVSRNGVAAPICCGELSRKARFLIYWSIFVPTLTYGQEIWVLIERMQSQIQAAEMGFLLKGGWAQP